MFFLLGLWTSLAVVLSVVPAIIALVDGESRVFTAFISTSVGAGFFALMLIVSFWGYERRRTMGALILLPVLGFFILALVGGLPQYLLDENSSWALILFEGMSAITTTGVSAYEDPDSSLYALHVWRALLSWLGAFGSVVLALTIANHVNSGGLRLHKSPVHSSDAGQGHARLSAIAKRLLPFYSGLSLIFFLLFLAAGSSVRDSFILALGAISTAGITVEAGSSLISGTLVQAVAMVTMLIAALNLDYHYAWYKGRREIYSQDGESRLFLIMLTAAIAAILIIRWLAGGALDGMMAFVWNSLFLAISALTTTGWIPQDGTHISYSMPLLLTMIGLACVGGTVSSTTGGLKILRMIILIRHGARELARLAHPHGVASLRFAGTKVSERDMQAVWLLVAGFLIFLIIGTLLLAIQGLGFQTSLLLALTSLTTSGPLMYLTDTDFAGFQGLLAQDYTVLSLLMLVGRLEVSIFLALLTKALWRT